MSLIPSASCIRSLRRNSCWLTTSPVYSMTKVFGSNVSLSRTPHPFLMVSKTSTFAFCTRRNFWLLHLNPSLWSAHSTSRLRFKHSESSLQVFPLFSRVSPCQLMRFGVRKITNHIHMAANAMSRSCLRCV
jgi:hypothetical protein